MVSYTGSTRAGIEVARNAAPTVKRVHQELGGKSPNIVLEQADLATAIPKSVQNMMSNSGQSCNAPSRMLVPRGRQAEIAAIAKQAAEAMTVGDPTGNANLGPVVSELQWNKIQGLIRKGIEEGATLVTGGPGRPDGLETGYYVKPTIFSDVTNDMTIAREEIFGPVMAILPYDSVEQAIEIGNDTPYGLAAYVQGTDPAKVADVASKLRAGQVILNGAGMDPMAPFGGFKQSGNGREWGDHAFAEFLETKAVMGLAA
jgi:aldehyde dehydrogenase (NAD+)